MSRSKDYYGILEVDQNVSEEGIKRAYRKLALKYHPDKSNLPDATQRFQDVSEAYSILKDSSKQEKYDEGRLGGDFTKEDGFDVFAEFMYGGYMSGGFQEEGIEYLRVDVPFDIAKNSGLIEVPVNTETYNIYIDGILSGKWKPFIPVRHDGVVILTLILKVSLPLRLDSAERRNLLRAFLGLQTLTLLARVSMKVVENYPLFAGVAGVAVFAAWMYFNNNVL